MKKYIPLLIALVLTLANILAACSSSHSHYGTCSSCEEEGRLLEYCEICFSPICESCLDSARENLEDEKRCSYYDGYEAGYSDGWDDAIAEMDKEENPVE